MGSEMCIRDTGAPPAAAAHAAPRDAERTPIAPPTHETSNFLRSYQSVADAVVRLTLHASDTHESELLESDVVQLMSANVLARARRAESRTASR